MDLECQPAPHSSDGGFRFEMRMLRSNYPSSYMGHSVDHEAIKVRAFEDQGIIVAKLDDPRLSWVDREELKRIGNKLFGPRA